MEVKTIEVGNDKNLNTRNYFRNKTSLVFYSLRSQNPLSPEGKAREVRFYGTTANIFKSRYDVRDDALFLKMLAFLRIRRLSFIIFLFENREYHVIGAY